MEYRFHLLASSPASSLYRKIPYSVKYILDQGCQKIESVHENCLPIIPIVKSTRGHTVECRI